MAPFGINPPTPNSSFKVPFRSTRCSHLKVAMLKHLKIDSQSLIIFKQSNKETNWMVVEFWIHMPIPVVNRPVAPTIKMFLPFGMSNSESLFQAIHSSTLENAKLSKLNWMRANESRINMKKEIFAPLPSSFQVSIPREVRTSDLANGSCCKCPVHRQWISQHCNHLLCSST